MFGSWCESLLLDFVSGSWHLHTSAGNVAACLRKPEAVCYVVFFCANIIICCNKQGKLNWKRMCRKLMKANSHIPCSSSAMPCRQGFRLCLSHLIYTVRQCLIHTCHAAHVPCRSESDFSRPLHSAASAWHGMCELASAVQRRHVGDLPAYGFFPLPRGVLRRLLSEPYHSVKL
jgi:hypothetical protein